MNVDQILTVLNTHDVRYLLIGGMNFLLRHQPVLTYDIDIWIEDDPVNLDLCERALAALDAEWGTTESDWGPVVEKGKGWLRTQGVFCLTSPHGSIDIFLSVAGLTDWQASFASAAGELTATGVPYRGLSDDDMLKCQEALDPKHRNADRTEFLRGKLKELSEGDDNVK